MKLVHFPAPFAGAPVGGVLIAGSAQRSYRCLISAAVRSIREKRDQRGTGE